MKRSRTFKRRRSRKSYSLLIPAPVGRPEGIQKVNVPKKEYKWISNAVSQLNEAHNPYPRHGTGAEKATWKGFRNDMKVHMYNVGAYTKYLQISKSKWIGMVNQAVGPVPDEVGGKASNPSTVPNSNSILKQAQKDEGDAIKTAQAMSSGDPAQMMKAASSDAGDIGNALKRMREL